MRPETQRWQDWASFALGLWLAVSPRLADYAAHDVATANAAICGILLALTAHFGFSFDHPSTEWLNLGRRLWVAASPFFLGFEGHHLAAVHALSGGTFL